MNELDLPVLGETRTEETFASNKKRNHECMSLDMHRHRGVCDWLDENLPAKHACAENECENAAFHANNNSPPPLLSRNISIGGYYSTLYDGMASLGDLVEARRKIALFCYWFSRMQDEMNRSRICTKQQQK